MSTLFDFPGIYLITNTVSGGRYIGSAQRISKRWGEHLSGMRCGTHHNIALMRAAKKYGIEVFSFEVVEQCAVTELMVREQHYLDTVKPEYNLCPTTGQGTRGLKHTSAQRKANSERSKTLSNTPARQAAFIARMRRIYADPEYKLTHAERMRALALETPSEVRQARYTDDVKAVLSIKAAARAQKHSVHGELLSVAGMAEKYKISTDVLRRRVARGWSFERAVSTPPDKKHSTEGSKIHKYKGRMYSLQGLVQFADCTKVAIFRRLKSGMSVVKAVEMTREQAEVLRLKKSHAARGKKRGL